LSEIKHILSYSINLFLYNTENRWQFSCNNWLINWFPKRRNHPINCSDLLK
jgi:hypothetical protein